MLKVVRNLHKVLPILVAIFSIHITIFVGENTFAENITTNVSVEPSLTVSIPSGPLNLTLDPAVNTFGTNNLNVTVGTNNDTGYIMKMESNSTDLINTADSTKIIPTLTNLSGGYTDSTFTTNRWGYKQDSGNYNNFKLTQTILENDGRTNQDSTTLTFATKIDYTQPSGLYNNTLVFTTIANPPVYMQDVTSSMCTTDPSTVVDKRDGNRYMIRRLADGLCWMVQNLNFKGSSNDPSGTMTLSTETSNVSRDTTLTYTDLTTTESYDDPKIHISGNNVNGVWYNYAAASAGTITGSSNSIESYNDVCPRGWRMPTRSEIDALVSAIGSTPDTFNPILSGNYVGAELINTGISRWWTSTPVSGSLDQRFRLGYNGSVLATFNGTRNSGLTVRCVHDTRTLANATITTMQDMTPTVATNTVNRTPGASKTLTDSRDSKTYTVKEIGGDIWMTKNLAFGCNSAGSAPVATALNFATSNIDKSTSYTTPTALLTAASSSTQTADMSNGRIQCNSTYGAWYSYPTATAGTITGTSNTNEAKSDICPRGWQLPSDDQSALIVSNIGSSPSAFSPVTGGHYMNGAQYGITNPQGDWWTSAPTTNAETRRTLDYQSSTSKIIRSGAYRYTGIYIRCAAHK